MAFRLFFPRFFLQAEGEAGEEGAGDGGAVYVACVAVHATVEVALVGIEDVLHPGVYLEGVDLIERYVIGQLEAEVEEVGGEDFGVLGYVAREVLHEHTPGVFSGEAYGEAAQWLNLRGEVAVVVRGAEHTPLRRDGLGPLEGVDVAALLPCVAQLEGEDGGVGYLGLHVQPRNACAGGVGAEEDAVALSVKPLVHEGEYVVELSEKAFEREAGLPAAEPFGEVGGEACAVGGLLTQRWVEFDERHVAAGRANVEVLLVDLRCAVAHGIACAEDYLLNGRVAQACAGRADGVFQQVMLFETCADEYAPHLVLPFVLEVSAIEMHLLADVAAVAEYLVAECVIAVLHSCREVGGEKEEMVHRVAVLRTGHDGQVVRLAVGIWVAPCAVVAVACDVLSRGVDAEHVCIVRGEVVELEAARIDVMFRSLGNVGLMLRQVETVAAAPFLAHVVVFRRNLGVGRGLEERAEAHGRAFDEGYLGKAVAVAVVSLTLAYHSEEEDANLAVGGDERAVESGVHVERASANEVCAVAQGQAVGFRLFGDDIHHAADGVCAVHGRASAAHHLDAVNHAGGNLLQAVDGGERGEDGAAVHENLGVFAAEAVDAELRRTAVLARLLNAEASLEVEHLGHGVGGRGLEGERRYNIDYRGGLALACLVFAGGDYHIVHHVACLAESDVEFCGLARLHDDGEFLRFVAHHAGYDSDFASGHIHYAVVASRVGHSAYVSAFDLYSHIGHVFARGGIDDMASKVCVSALRRRSGRRMP